MKLKKLLQDLDVKVKGSKEIEISGICSDSRKVSFGNLFLARRGSTFDGTQFIPQAVNAGALAIGTDIYDPFLDVVQIIHPNIDQLEAAFASRFYANPSKELFVVGVTGTKGKTTSAYLIKHVLEPAGLISTVETLIQETQFFSTLTTHDVIFNQKWLREMVKQNCESAVLEVSSHGLDQGRVDRIEFDLGVFTNLFPDHLDYHLDIDHYASAKKKLFEKAKRSILNADSPYASLMGTGLTYGIENGEVRSEDLIFKKDRTTFTVQKVPFSIPLIGRFNVYNALAAVCVGLEKGISLEKISEKLANFPQAPARLERIGNVFIDFAHSGEALKNVLETLREIVQGRLIVVFGAGGDRDPNRRTSMGKAADALADISIITNDNPRKEDPEQIASQIAESFERYEPIVELDRRKAIQKAIEMANSEDLILVAGRGHEREQIFRDQTFPFDDRAVIQELV